VVQEKDNEEELLGEPSILEEPEQELELGEAGSVQTLAEAEEEAPHQTDLQAVLKYLHPKYKDVRLNELLQSAMSSRVFPDNFWAKHRLIVTSLVEEYAEDGKDVDLIGIISMSQDALSIGFEGRGRVEDLEVAGVAHEEELERLSKELGMG
jgi:hypothetical protein